MCSKGVCDFVAILLKGISFEYAFCSFCTGRWRVLHSPAKEKTIWERHSQILRRDDSWHIWLFARRQHHLQVTLGSSQIPCWERFTSCMMMGAIRNCVAYLAHFQSSFCHTLPEIWNQKTCFSTATAMSSSQILASPKSWSSARILFVAPPSISRQKCYSTRVSLLRTAVSWWPTYKLIFTVNDSTV